MWFVFLLIIAQNDRSNGMETSIKEGQKARYPENYLLNFYHDALVVVKLDQFLCEKQSFFFPKKTIFVVGLSR